MNDDRKSRQRPVIRVVAGLCATCAAAGAAVLVPRIRTWAKQLETPPLETARREWTRVKAIPVAARDKWRNGHPAKQAKPAEQATESQEQPAETHEKQAETHEVPQ